MTENKQAAPVDPFCSNAGILAIRGYEVSNEEWQGIWEITKHESPGFRWTSEPTRWLKLFDGITGAELFYGYSCGLPEVATQPLALADGLM